MCPLGLLFGTKPLSESIMGYCPLTLANIFQWNFNKDTEIFIEENAFETVVCKMAVTLSRDQCVNNVRCFCRVDSKLAPNQWETSLQSNAVSHWLCAYLESALLLYCTVHVHHCWFQANVVIWLTTVSGWRKDSGRIGTNIQHAVEPKRLKNEHQRSFLHNLGPASTSKMLSYQIYRLQL